MYKNNAGNREDSVRIQTALKSGEFSLVRKNYIIGGTVVILLSWMLFIVTFGNSLVLQLLLIEIQHLFVGKLRKQMSVPGKEAEGCACIVGVYNTVELISNND